MNKLTLSSVKDVIPDIGDDFQLDPNVIASKTTSLLLLPAHSRLNLCRISRRHQSYSSNQLRDLTLDSHSSCNNGSS
jgi:hypothetical protein